MGATLKLACVNKATRDKLTEELEDHYGTGYRAGLGTDETLIIATGGPNAVDRAFFDRLVEERILSRWEILCLHPFER